jgi:hypothetical protein
MVFGSSIHATGTVAPTPYFTAWTGRGGDSAIFVADVIALNLTTSPAKLVITIQSKNSEDPDAAGTAQDLGAFDDITPPIPSTPRTRYLSGLKELYRFKIEVYGNPSSDWVHMRMLRPSWLRN